MKTLLKYLLGTAFLTWMLMACKQDPPPKFHFEYFGMEDGRYIIYEATEIFHDNALGVHDTSIYQLKAVWGDVYIDNEGRQGREYLLYKRADASSPWISVDVWHGVIDGIRAELVEENERKVKLIFPPTIDKEWDANAYTMLDEQLCYYRDIHGDTLINGISYDSTLVVEQSYEPSSLVGIDRQYEMYAKGIGLIYKYYKVNKYEIFNPIPQEGNELYLEILESGFE
jgi:hypothetical protein